VLRHAETVIVNSEATGSVVRLYGVKDEIIKTVNPPLSWDPGAVNLDEETGLAGRLGLRGRRILLVAGRLVGRKGVHVAIGALKTITTRHPETVLLVAGDGPERGSLEKIAKDRALESSVIFTGRLSDAEFRDAFRAATIVLYPSLDLPNDLEGFGIGAADAGIFGKPVVASRIGGLPEAVQDGETGLLVEPGDPDALAVAVIRLLEEDGLASKLGEGGRRLALTRTHESFRQRFRDSLLPKT
jgi:phosphatidylinositol alpha-1,6-mannosyltransferase